VIDRLGDTVGESAGSDVVNQLNRIIVAELPATIDHFLGAPLHFRIAALHGSESRSASWRPLPTDESGTAAETDFSIAGRRARRSSHRR